MVTFDLCQYNDVYFVGDIHGEYEMLHNEIKNKIRNNSSSMSSRKRKFNTITDNSVIIVLGDIGLGFNKFEYYVNLLKPLNETLNGHKIHLFFIRGNHDNPKYFNEDLFKFSNIHTLPDYSVVMTATHNILCVGGAISTDRTWRLDKEKIINRYRTESNHKEMWWNDETFIFNEDEINAIKSKKISIDIVATHIPPNHSNIQKRLNDIEYWSSVDDALKNDLKLENENVFKLQESLKDFHIICWASGHTHLHNRFKDNDINYLQYGNNYNITSVDEEISSLKELEETKKVMSSQTILSNFTWHTVTTGQTNPFIEENDDDVETENDDDIFVEEERPF